MAPHRLTRRSADRAYLRECASESIRLTQTAKCHTRGLANRSSKQSAAIALLLLRPCARRCNVCSSHDRARGCQLGGRSDSNCGVDSSGTKFCLACVSSPCATRPRLRRVCEYTRVLLYGIVCRRAVIDHSAPCVDLDQASANRAQTVRPVPNSDVTKTHSLGQCPV